MKKTPLHAQHLELGARMGEFGGWDMPIQYAGILQEHQHTRTKASVFDICHMGEFELSGPSALQDLENLLTCNIPTLEVGQVRYGFMLNDDGGVIDDLTCYRLDDERYMLVVNAGTATADSAWIQSHLSSKTRFIDLSPSMAKLDVQGPESRHVLEDVFGCPLPNLGYFRFKEFQALDAACILSRTGYTGEWGYEIYLPNASVVQLWNKLVAHELIAPGGLGGRDTLRLEMGYPLYGHELSAARTPVATSRGAFINISKDFIGKANVQADLDDPEVLLVGLKFDSKRAAREHDKVYFDGIEVGEVTSGSLAPSLGVAVAMAFVEPEFAELGRELQVEIRGKTFPAEVVALPFYKNGTARG
ncbi:MAG: glycine cleavage system aminomethyltransferase GcvT [Kiritimatiellales bacterium]|nr:glycine cleavage system aminomethyltransferase GcvT [Kiritimatiellales bacterium]MCF7864730.1 glycine cleavage system aminomethyltransferase GcvT [Kiritimatiellales bacterium]